MESNQSNKQNTNTNNEKNNDYPDYKKIMLNSIIEKAVKCSKYTTEKIGNFMESVLSKDTEKLKDMSAKGLPDDLPILRSLIWKINLGYLPIDSNKWNDIFKTQREAYIHYKKLFNSQLKEEVLLLDQFNKKSKEERKLLESTTNKILLEDITKDINRTHMHLSFFFQPLDKNKVFSNEELKSLIDERRNCTLNDINKTYKININETHADVVARILFIYAKFAPDVTYIQGMNEIIAPIYYCFSSDKFTDNDEVDFENIEADTFWSFYFLMNKIKYVFIREEDENDRGINVKAYKLQKMIGIMDNDILKHFQKNEVDFSFFAPRWFILFFSQDFLIIDILRLWDYIFCEEDKFKNVFYVALAIILIKKDNLLAKDLGGILKELQDFEGIMVDTIINNALIIEEVYGDEMNKIINEN